MHDNVEIGTSYRVLHAVVGHKFPDYFINAVNSVRLMTENDDILIVDNASNLTALAHELQLIADEDPRVRLLLRETNDISRNSKVGGLYDAYNEVVSYALRQGYDYLHIVQNDMQMLWWDETVMRQAREIYAEYPECVNIPTIAQPQHSALGDDLEYVKPKLVLLRRYGLTDTGIYDLAKWRALDMRFEDSERAHAQKYLNQGLRVLFHPLPTVAFIPWPAVVRSGRIIGREIQPRQQFLLRPLSPSEIGYLKETTEPVWLESVAVPWGWTCLTPYWFTDLSTIDYWVYRYRDTRSHGLRAAWPRWERRGLPDGTSLLRVQRQPSWGLLPVLVLPAWNALRQAIRRGR